jgi:dienelactone hydrolase
VLKDFFDGERLKEIPASRKKRSVILKWLANRFEYGVLYKEAQVNEIIQRHHEDASSLRRELISAKEQFMQRESGFYWRVPAGGENWHSVVLRSADHFHLPARVGTPSGPGPFPTILELHEGPGFMQTDWISPLAQTWVEAGFAYMVVNFLPVEINGHTIDFLERVMGQPVSWALNDLLTAKSWLVEHGIADPARVLLVGWSYNAFAVLAAAGKFPKAWTKPVWGGVIAGDPITDWLQEYEAALDKAVLQELFRGSPEKWRSDYISNSPIEYADKVLAPILLLQSENAPRAQQDALDHYKEKLPGSSELYRYPERNQSGIERMVEQQEVMLNFARQIFL